MQVDIVDLLEFYRGSVGRVVALLLSRKILSLWPPTEQNRILGLGFTSPYLESCFNQSERVLVFMPASQGVYPWPQDQDRAIALVDIDALPLPDSSIDQILMVHALELINDPIAALHEAWRVLTPGGRILIIVPSRRGIWARTDRSPFGFGRPYNRNQLQKILRDALFSPEHWDAALYFPPSHSRFVLNAASSWERLGHQFWPTFSGVIIVEARKQMYQGLPLLLDKRKHRVVRPTLVPAV